MSPSSARAEDATGALPLHWATRNPEISFELIDLLLKSYPEAPTKADSKGFLPLHWAVNQVLAAMIGTKWMYCSVVDCLFYPSCIVY